MQPAERQLSRHRSKDKFNSGSSSNVSGSKFSRGQSRKNLHKEEPESDDSSNIDLTDIVDGDVINSPIKTRLPSRTK